MSTAATLNGDIMLFLDRAIDGNTLFAELRRSGASVRRHRDEFADAETDIRWLTEVGCRGWFVLTRDERIKVGFVENPLASEASQHSEVAMSSKGRIPA